MTLATGCLLSASPEFDFELGILGAVAAILGVVALNSMSYGLALAISPRISASCEWRLFVMSAALGVAGPFPVVGAINTFGWMIAQNSTMVSWINEHFIAFLLSAAVAAFIACTTIYLMIIWLTFAVE